MYRSIAPSWSTLCCTCLRKQLILQQRRCYGTNIGSTTVSKTYSFLVHGAPGAASDDKTLREIFDKPSVWRQFRSKLHDPATPRTGLFQNKDLTSPNGLQRYASKTLHRAKKLVERVCAASTREELLRVVQDLDHLSDLLCRVIDMADFVRSTHPERGMVMAAHEAYGSMYEYMQVLNTTTGLYEALKRARDDPEVVRRLTTEERKVADILYADFEKCGVNLPENMRKRFVKLSGDVAELGATFLNGIEPRKPYLEFDSPRLTGIDPVVARGLTDQGKTRIPTTGMAAQHVLGTANDPQVRKELFVASHTTSDRQIWTLEELLKARAQQAILVGCNSFGQLALQDKMAQTPQAVMQFLQELAIANLPAAQTELDQLSGAKLAHCGSGMIEPWDRDYYANKLPLDRRVAMKAYPINEYFSLGTVMQGLSRVFTRLYGIRFVPREPSRGETWNDDVRRLDVISETDGHIAVVYCDLFQRAGKHPNPAHFTVRCSRRLLEEELTEAVLSGEPAGDGMASARRNGSGDLYQLPTIALICDFPRGNPTLLHFRNMQTLFHEMGHAVHSMLGRTSLHNIAGTRCATDWAELPSVLMEHFAKDPHVLALFARHHATDEPLPFPLLQEHLNHNWLMEAFETRYQIVLALLDQRLHSHLPLEPGFSSTTVYREVEREFSLLPHPEGTSWQGFFGHLHSYGATYYSYLFDRAIAARIWSDVFEVDPLDRARGEMFKEEVLRWGGGRDGWACLAGVLRRPELEGGGEEAMREVGRWGSEMK